MTFQLVACDLDGTLLDGQRELGRVSRDVLRAIVTRGVELVLATGRHGHQARATRSSLDVPAHVISSNGACIEDPAGNLVYRRDLEPALIADLVELGLSHRALVNVYRHDDWLVIGTGDDLPERHRHNEFPFRAVERHAFGFDRVCKVFYIADHDRLRVLEHVLRMRFERRIDVAFSVDDCLEVTADGVNKGRALSFVMERAGLSADVCLAFGDGMNDVEMLKLVGRGVLMGNASARVRALLPNAPTIGSHEHEAVAVYLRELYLSQGRK